MVEEQQSKDRSIDLVKVEPADGGQRTRVTITLNHDQVARLERAFSDGFLAELGIVAIDFPSNSPGASTRGHQEAELGRQAAKRHRTPER